MKDYEMKLTRAQVAYEVCKWCDEQIEYAESEVNGTTLARAEYIENNPEATASNDWHMECYDESIEKASRKVVCLHELIELISKKF